MKLKIVSAATKLTNQTGVKMINTFRIILPILFWTVLLLSGASLVSAIIVGLIHSAMVFVNIAHILNKQGGKND